MIDIMDMMDNDGLDKHDGHVLLDEHDEHDGQSEGMMAFLSHLLIILILFWSDNHICK